MRQAFTVTILVVLVIMIILGMSTTVEASTSGTVSPSVSEFKILRGTDGSKLGYITYSGSAPVSAQWGYCNITVSTAPPQSGLYAEVISKLCRHDGNNVKVEIKLSVKGVYSGGDFDWNPFSAIRVNLYYNKSLVDTVYFSATPISIREVKINRIDFGNPPIDTSSISYTVLPKTDVNTGTSVFITTSATINLVAELSDYLSVPTTVEVQYLLQTSNSGSGGSSKWKTVYVTFETNTLTTSFSIPDVPLTTRLPLSVILNNITIFSTNIDVPSKASEINVGGAVISTADPVQFWEKQRRYKIVSQLYINRLQGGTVTITMHIDGLSSAGPRTYSDEGPVNDLVVYSNNKLDKITGNYEILYNGPYGSAPKVVVKFSSSYQGTTGGLLKNVFYILFTFIVSAGFAGVVIGLLLRRPDLQSSGMIMLSSGVFVFLIPTLMGYVVALLTHTGVEDPLGISNLNLMNLGDLLDASIRYIKSKALGYSAILFGVAMASVTIISVLAGIVTGGGIIGWLTAGALSEFLGQVLGTLGSQILTLATLSFMASIFLKILAIIFPIVLNVIFTILLFTALLQALFAGFTGSYAQVYSTVMSLSMLVLMVLLTPCILATLDRLMGEQKIIELPLVGPIPDIFSILGLVIIQILILVMILAMGFQRLMAVLSGMGGG